MKTTLAFSLISLTFLCSCSLLPSCITSEQSALNWIDRYIQNMGTMDEENKPIEIWSYYYLQDTVYFFRMPCCDRLNTVYNYSGIRICAPDGGITGKGDFQCPEFFDTARKLDLLWSEEVRDWNPRED